MADVKLLAPQRITDNPDGGGLATTTEIVDGEINNLFDDISRVDRVNGDVSLRKLFAVANTPDADLFSGLHLIIRQPPFDPRVEAVMFAADAAGGWAGTRAQAQAFVERYLDQSVRTRMIPYDRQLVGQRTVLVWQRPELPLPTIGEVYVLENEAAGTSEFFRVQDVDHQVQTFTDNVGNFDYRIITMTITQPLSREYPGTQPNRYETVDDDASLVRQTVVSDAARYKGTVGLAEDAEAGDLTIRLGTVFGQLVPAATQEVAITDARPQGTTVVHESGGADITINGLGLPSFNSVYVKQVHLPTAILPGSLFFDSANAGRVGDDDGQGVLVQSSGSSWGGTANIDYASGVLTFTNLVVGASPFIRYRTAAEMGRSGSTYHQPVTVGTRGFVYIATLHPAPLPGTAVVSFRALGRWYDLVDDGTGALVGDVGAGTGTVNFITGTVTVTLGGLPDIGSSVIFSWAGDSELEILTDDVAGVVPAVPLQLSAGNCEPGTLAVSWLSGGVAKTAADNGEGAITGDATGRVVYGTGEVSIRPTLLPDDNTVFAATYESGDTQTELFNPAKVGSTITITAAEAPVRPRSILVTYQQTIVQGLITSTTTQQLADNGEGQLVDAEGQVKAGSVVNYTTGAISFNPDFTAITPVLSYEEFEQRIPGRVNDPSTGYFRSIAQFGRWPVACGAETTEIGFADGTNVTLQYKADDAADGEVNDAFPAPPLILDLVPTRTNAIVPGGLMFRLGGRVHVDRLGSIYHTINTQTGAGVLAGTINYSTGEVTLSDWVGGIAPSFTVDALLTQVRPLPVSVVTGRTPGSPLRPASFFLQANRYRDGALLSAVADQNGNILTANMRGTIDINTGVYTIAFGEWVLDSSLTTEEKLEPWYDVDAIDGDGYIWKPDEVEPGTVRFNAVVQTALPLDPTIIGVNPVRLPLDGRVQVIRAGDTLVIHDTQAFELPTPVAGATVALPRGSLAPTGLRVYDAATTPVEVDPALYTADLEAGEITWTDPLDLSAYDAPFTATHAQEDMVLCTDAQITGEVTLAYPLAHDYTAANSMCSSALVLGDVSARYGQLFEQNTWTNEWRDELIGSPPGSGAAYNDIAFPLALLNEDAITQRWRLSFTSATAFNIVGEELGVVGTGNTSANVAPINPQTGAPYFTMASGGFGSGWATGNQIRFNTYAAGAPVWIGRVVRPGPATFIDDRIQIEPRWDKD